MAHENKNQFNTVGNNSINNAQHYYTENPTSEIREKTFSYNHLNFTSVSGVFGFQAEVDKASRLLIENFEPSSENSKILDIGCGFGAIGLSIKHMWPTLIVNMVDINNRACDYALKNARLNSLDVTIRSGDLFEPFADETFDEILSNPPIAVGKKFNTRLITESFSRLNDGGSLWLVAFHNKGGSTLKSIMKDVFGNVEDVEKKGGIRVYRSSK